MPKPTGRNAALLLALLVQVACSDSDKPAPINAWSAGSGGAGGGSNQGGSGGLGGSGGTGGQAGQGQGGTAGLAGAGGTAGDAGGGGTAGVAGQGGTQVSSNYGHIAVNTNNDKTSLGYNASAEFLAQGPTCNWKPAGQCEIGHCEPPIPPSRLSAGDVTIQGGKLPLTLTPDSTGLYALVGETGKSLFAGGETLTFKAVGAQVPAFQQTLVAPTPVTVQAPVLPLGQLFSLDRTKPLQLQWTPGAQGKLQVQIQLSGSSTADWVRCRFELNAGTGEISVDALSVLTPPSGFLTISSFADASVVAGEVGVGLEATALCTTPEGYPTTAGVSIK